MIKRIPKKLHKSPLIDVLFECRFDTTHPLSNIVPGILFSELDGDKKIEPLIHSNVPEQFRKNDPNFQYLPLVKIICNNYSFLVGDKSIIVSCELPYNGWENFKLNIINIINIIINKKIINKILRYSIKYVNILEANTIKEQVDSINLILKIGDSKLKEEAFQVRIDIPEGDLINILQIISDVRVDRVDGVTLNGILIDIDTIKTTKNFDIERVQNNLEVDLDLIHEVNKKIFFECLTENTLSKLEPEYE